MAPIRFKKLFGSGPLRSLTFRSKGLGPQRCPVQGADPRGWISARGDVDPSDHPLRTSDPQQRDADLAICKQRVRQLMAGGRTEESIQTLTRCLQVHGEKRPNDSEP